MATILIVDDRRLCRDFLMTLLKYSHHRLLEADDGASALAILKSDRPDLIITDLLMPTMNGYEFVKLIKEDPATAKIPVIFYTASFLIEEAKLLAETCGVDCVLFKPCDPQLILDTVSQMLAKNPSAEITVKSQVDESMTKTLSKIKKYKGEECCLTSMIQSFESDKSLFISSILSLQNVTEEGTDLSKRSMKFVDAYEKLTQSSRLLNSSLNLVTDLAFEREARHFLNTLCFGLCSVLDSESCAVGILDPCQSEQSTLKYFMTSDSHGAHTEKYKLNLMNTGVINEILRLDKGNMAVLHRPDEHLKLELPNYHKEINSFMGLKLITPSHLYGFVYLINKNDGIAYSEIDQNVGSIILTAASVMYESIELYDIIQRHAAKLQISANSRSKKTYTI